VDRTRRALGLLARLIAVAVGVVAACLAAEGTARIYFWFASSGATTVASAPAVKVGQYDPRLGYRLTPNTTGHLQSAEFDTHFRINASGLRMEREVPFEKPPGKRRVLLLGDSFTFGHGVNDRDRFGDKLESLLDGVEVVNMGVWGTGTDQQLLLYEEQGVKYGADLVILCFFTENIQRNASSARLEGSGRLVGKPRFVLREGKLVLTNVPVPEIVPDEGKQRRAWELRDDQLGGGIPLPFKRVLQHTALYELLRGRLAEPLYDFLGRQGNLLPEYDETREEWKVTRALLERLAAEVRLNGSAFLLVVVPLPPQVTRNHVDDRPHRMIRAMGEADKIPVLDLLPGLREAARAGRGTLYFPIDGHWTPAGHTVAAELIAEYLVRSYPWVRRSGT